MSKSLEVSAELLNQLIYGDAAGRRYTQDTAVMPDVWFDLGKDPAGTCDLLLVPDRSSDPGKLNETLAKTLATGRRRPVGAARAVDPKLAYNESSVVATLDLDQIVGLVLPLTNWWWGSETRPNLGPLGGASAARVLEIDAGRSMREADRSQRWLLRLLAALVSARDGRRSRGARGRTTLDELPSANSWAPAVAALLAPIPSKRPDVQGRVWSVNRNRQAQVSTWSSMKTTKADAAVRLFDLKADGLTWAVLDTGIDAGHPAFGLRDTSGKLLKGALSKRSRVLRSFDFTRLRDVLAQGNTRRRRQELVRRIQQGLPIDWTVLEHELEIPHDRTYKSPEHAHGTHVAGILAGDWRPGEPGMEGETEPMVGVCRDLRLYDLRVLRADGGGDEFSIIGAMQFLRYLNSMERRPAIQGINLSLSIPHDVRNFACGRTPVCEEAERMIANGVVTVVAAGNDGYSDPSQQLSGRARYHDMSITDPGNAQNVITVGATHRSEPHTYGVSFFSSRGPTGDGRKKPDLVAPGEKIYAPIPGKLYERRDGTSMAAPHVSGAAALLMSRHAELVGEPLRIKEILLSTATDLGREHDFQGAGLLDICRALQSI